MGKLKLTQAFTMIELLVVIAIIFVIAGMILGVGRSAREAAKKNKAAAMIASLGVAISMYHADTGAYPPDDSVSGGCPNLYLYLDNADPDEDDSANVDGWDGPYMEVKDEDLNDDEDEIIDPWGNEYNYRRPGTATTNLNSYDLWSDGVDTDVTTDDITNW